MADGNWIVLKEKTQNILLSCWKTSDVIFIKNFTMISREKNWKLKAVKIEIAFGKGTGLLTSP